MVCTYLTGASMNVLLAVDGSQVRKCMRAYLAAHTELMQPTTRYTVLTVVVDSLTPVLRR
jgi:hypothetical protein